MSDIISHTSAADSFDPQVIEARLNALVGNVTQTDEIDTPDLLQQFLADPTLNWLGSRSVNESEEAGIQHSIIEYHRVPTLANQTRVVLHLSFRPDLPVPPKVEANLIDSDGRTRVTHCTTFGARIEITLSQSESIPSTVCVEAICTTAQNISSN